MLKVKDEKLYATIKAFLTHYLPKVKQRSEHTVQSYRDAINLFLDFLKVKKGLPKAKVTIPDFNSDNVVGFLEWLETERNCGIATRNQRLMSIRSFCKYLSRDDAVIFHAYSLITEIKPTPKPDAALSETLTGEQMRALLELADASNSMGLRDRFFIALLYDTGCRIDELLSMKLGDLTPGKDSGSVQVIGKGRKFRVTPISYEVVQIFNDYRAAFHPARDMTKPLFYTKRSNPPKQMSPDNAARILKKYEVLSKKGDLTMPHLHAHLFRHTRAIHLYQAGMPLALISEWLGHTHIETTRIYAYADTEMKRAAAGKIQVANTPVFTDEPFKYADDDMTIKRLYGLA